MKFLPLVLLLLVCPAMAQMTIPAGAKKYGSILKREQERLWPDHPRPGVLFGQVEQETCVSLSNIRCWTPNAQLKTEREYGFSFGQFTIAYNADGSERFNTWKELRSRNLKELAGWTWENRLDPTLGLRAIVLYDYQLYRSVSGFAKGMDQVRFSLSAYNGGLGGLLSDVKLCQQKPNCDPRSWYGINGRLGVADTSNKSRTKWKGYGLSAYEINRGYITSIEQRMKKYELLQW